MKKILITIVVLAIALLGFPRFASAEAPHLVSADFTYVPNCPAEDMKWANDNLFIYCTDEGEWKGDFVGTSFEDYVAVLHGFEGFFIYKTGFYRGNATFRGVVEGREGTLEILFIGKSLGDINDWTGTWRIISGTGELENLNGTGTFYNNDQWDIHIDGQIHFEP
jgi:hypothetical protein